MGQTKILLQEKDKPAQWCDIMADMPKLPAPPLHPATLKPCGPDDLGARFPMSLIEQEVSTQRWMDMPDEALKAEALKAKDTGREKVIVFPLSGHGNFDMQAYADYDYPDEKIREAMSRLPSIPA